MELLTKQSVSVRVEKNMGSAAEPERSNSTTVGTMKVYYKKRMASSLARQELLLPYVGSSSSSTLIPTKISSNSPVLQPPPCIPSGEEQYEVGGFYEIDQSHLPPRSPSQLKEIRVVKVTGKTNLDLTVSFPSMQSLRQYFKIDNDNRGRSSITPVNGRGKRKLDCDLHPELDEKFVMSTNHSLRILRRLVPSEELDSSKNLEKFWVVKPKTYDNEEEDEVGGKEQMEVADSCTTVLKSTQLLRWGMRRRVNYGGRQKGKLMGNSSSWSSLDDSGKEINQRANTEDAAVGKKRGRKYGSKKMKDQGKRKSKRESKKEKVSSKFALALVPSYQSLKTSKDRWSSERYETAELKLLDIMKKKNAVLGHPILRTELREEARNHIGDTGLLDHLLKHMAGKVVSEGKERFRRRHNSDGAMEYWLEDAELEEVRRIAGVKDSSWIPPPGWKVEDGLYLGGGNGCEAELKNIKEEIVRLKRAMEEIQCLKQLRQVDDQKISRDAQSRTESSSTNLQENYQNLLKWKTKLEDEMLLMISSLNTLKEDMRVMKEEIKQIKELQLQRQLKNDKHGAEENSGTVIINEHSKGKISNQKENLQTNYINTTTANNITRCSNDGSVKNNSSRMARKSGFRIYKPERTFLWPNMMPGAGSSTSNTATVTPTADVSVSQYSSNVSMASPRAVVVPYGDVFGLPTPPSASSVTSPPVLQFLGNNVCNTNTSTTTTVVVRHRHCHQEQIVLGERNFAAGSAISDTATLFQHSSHGTLLPMANMMMESGGGGWNAAISTDLALASPSYRA